MAEDLFSSREEEIFRTLRELKDCDFVVIGGYAVNAYTLPRFSVDCDIVVRDEDGLKKIEKVLAGLEYRREAQGADLRYAGSFSRYEKSLENNFRVSVDILIKSVADRATKAEFSADWIFRNSEERTLRGKTRADEIRLKIINRDALIAMKMTSCRVTDIRDVFMMLPDAEDKDWIKSEVSRRYSLKDRIAKISEKVNSRQFRDGLAGVYGGVDLRTFDRHKKAVEEF